MIYCLESIEYPVLYNIAFNHSHIYRKGPEFLVIYTLSPRDLMNNSRLLRVYIIPNWYSYNLLLLFMTTGLFRKPG
jgi:hypothetical protein